MLFAGIGKVIDEHLPCFVKIPCTHVSHPERIPSLLKTIHSRIKKKKNSKFKINKTIARKTIGIA